MIIYFLDFFIPIVGILSVIIIGIMPVYFILKYKSLGALAYWDYGTKKERMLINSGYIGLLIYLLLSISSSVLKNSL